MHDTRLLPFLAAHRDDDLRTLTGAVAAAARSDGLWQIPPEAMEPARRTDWASNVAYEVQLFGVTAHGFSPMEAARNWRRTALNLAGDALGAVAAPTGKDAA